MIAYDKNALRPSNDTRVMDAVPSTREYYTYKISTSWLVTSDTHQKDLRILSLRAIEHFNGDTSGNGPVAALAHLLIPAEMLFVCVPKACLTR